MTMVKVMSVESKMNNIKVTSRNAAFLLKKKQQTPNISIIRPIVGLMTIKKAFYSAGEKFRTFTMFTFTNFL